MREPVIIVGGGLAGLACARSLEAKGVPYRLFEASDRIGGRVKTDRVDGFLLDRGFQVYFPAYPNASKVLDHAALDLRPFKVGAKVWDGRHLRTLDAGRPFATLTQGALGPFDLLRLLLLTVQASIRSVERIRNLPDTTTDAELRRRGFSEGAIRRFFRPFYGGVFVDPSLGVSRRQFMFVQKMLTAAPAALPNSGMESIPLNLARPIPLEKTTFDSPVECLLRDSTGRVDGVQVRGEKVGASQVVLATDADTAARLSGSPLSREWLGSVALYLETERPPYDGAYIALNGTGAGRVNEIVPLSNAAPGYAPEGRHLLCAVVLGDPTESDEILTETVSKEIRAICPAAGELRPLRLDRVPHHQLTQRPGFDAPPPEAPPGLILAGEVTTNCSIDGAIASGMRAAETVTA